MDATLVVAAATCIAGPLGWLRWRRRRSAAGTGAACAGRLVSALFDVLDAAYGVLRICPGRVRGDAGTTCTCDGQQHEQLAAAVDRVEVIMRSLGEGSGE